MIINRDMEKKKIYISGAITGFDLEERKSAFHRAASYLSLKGYEAVNPFENGLPQPGSRRDHLRADLGTLLVCDGIYLLDGWYVSEGSKLELLVASSCGLDVMFECAGL